MPKKIIIGLVGQMLSGKGTVAKYLEYKHNAVICQTSSPLRDVLKRLNIEITRQNLQLLSQSLRNIYGQDTIAKAIAKDIENIKSGIIVVEGIRRLEDIKYAKNFPEFILVSIDADIKTRYERLSKRNENLDDNKKSFEEFEKDHSAEPEMEIAEVAKTAKYKINNSGLTEELEKQIEEILLKENYK